MFSIVTYIKTLILFFVTTFTCKTAMSQNLMPNRSILENTFMIVNNSELGTCFTAFYEKQEYLITARHIFKNISQSGDTADFIVKAYNQETNIKGKVYFHPLPEIDVAVVKIDKRISKVEPIYVLDNAAQRYGIGQDSYFLGFPLGFSSHLSQGQLPLVKRATISGINDLNGKTVLLLDGLNNVGFSGGPVVTNPVEATNPGISEQFIIGIISAYYIDPHIIEVPDAKGGIQKITYNSNSGIILCFPTALIIETIQAIK